VDFSGVVESVRKNVTRFKPRAVFGGRQGALAEYLAVAEQRLVKKPENTSFEQAGAVNMAAKTARQALRAKLQPGRKVLINGASGGVGTFAIADRQAAGREVTGVRSGRNTELLRSLGADHTIEYSRTTPRVARNTT